MDIADSTDSLASQLALPKASCFENINIDKNSAGPDHIASLDPKEFRNYVDAIHGIKILGKSKKDVQTEELNMRRLAEKPTLQPQLAQRREVNKRRYFFRPVTASTQEIDCLVGRLSDAYEGSSVLKELFKEEI